MLFRSDLILECVGNHPFSAGRRVLKPGGICVGVGASSGRWMLADMAGLVGNVALSPFLSRKFVPMVTKRSAPDLALLCNLLAAGNITPVIDRRYTLSEVPEAIRYLEAGHARGKVVIAVA